MSPSLRQRALLALTAAWGLSLVASFLLNRHDLPHLPEWLGSLGGALVGGPSLGAAGLAQSLAGLAVAGLIVLSWWGLGDLVIQRLRLGASPWGARGSRALDWSARALIGSGLWSTAWFFLGVSHLYRRPVAIVALAAGLALTGRVHVAWLGDSRPAERGPGGLIAWALIIIVQILALIAALAPPTATDTLLYHLALPKAYVAGGGMVEVPGNIASYYPLGVEMHSVWALLAGGLLSPRVGEAAAGATLFAFAPLLTLLTYGWARARGLGLAASAIAATIIATIPSAYLISASGFTDLALAGFTLLALAAAGRWWTTGDGRWLFIMAAAAGWALSAKLSAASLLVALAVLVLLRGLQAGREMPDANRRPVGALLFTGLGALAAAGILASPWYLRTWLRSGSPLFPFYSELWPRRIDIELRIGALISAAMFALWLLASQQLRYLLPAAPPLAVAIVAAAAAAESQAGAWFGRTVRGLLLAAAVANALVVLSWFAQADPVRVVLGGESRAAYLTRRLDYYPFYEVANRELPAGASVWLINTRRDTYYLDRPYFADFMFEDYTLKIWAQAARDPEEMRARARQAGITHVLVRHDILFDYERSSIVDDRLSREKNLARLQRIMGFFTEGTRLIRADQRFWLVELRPG